jgi:hypothetical protein
MIGLCVGGLALTAALCQAQITPPAMTFTKTDAAKEKNWLGRWDKNISGEVRGYRVCESAVGEDIAWVITPVLDGLYQGYMATKNTKYVDMLVDWTDCLIKRGAKEPDGYVGWPSFKAAGTDKDNLDNAYDADSMLSDAMVFRPIVLMAHQMATNPALKGKYAAKGKSYIKFAEQIYQKWATRGGWRDCKVGAISLVLPCGLDKTRTKWVDFRTRNDPGDGFSHPDNKASEVACWMLAMWDVTGKPEYKERAEKWFKLLKSRMTLKSDGTYEIWNYWQPAGPWDYISTPAQEKEDSGRIGEPKHWVGVHPRGGYYEMDTAAIAAAYQHGLVFTKADIDHLIATAKTSWRDGDPGSPAAGMEVSVQPSSGTAKEINACFPNSRTSKPTSAGAGALSGTVVSVEWDAEANKGKIVVQPKNAQAHRVTFLTNDDTKVHVLRMWRGLVPYDEEIQKNFEATADPESWGGLGDVSWYLMLQSELSAK